MFLITQVLVNFEISLSSIDTNLVIYL